MHADERDGSRRYRWTDGGGAVRLHAPAGGDGRLAAALRTYRPAGAPTRVRVRVNDRDVATWDVGADWAVYEAPVTLDGSALTVELLSDAFVQGYDDPRPLGVMVDWVEVR
jgi:hypothetical protein